MAYLLQISDPDELRVTLQLSGKYSPDLLDDAKRRLLDMYREALAARYPGTHGDSVVAQPDMPSLEDDE